MNHSVAAAAVVSPAPIAPSIPISTPTPAVLDGSRATSPAARPGHGSPRHGQDPAESGDTSSTQTIVHSSAASSYEEQDEGLTLTH